MHPKIHQRAALTGWSEGYEEIKQKTDRSYKSINCLMLVFSCRLEALGLRLHGDSCFIGFQGLFFLEQLAWADWMYHQLIFMLSISLFPTNLTILHQHPKLRVRYLSSTCTWRRRRCTSDTNERSLTLICMLCRIQSSYAALQRINQDLEDKMHRTVRSSRNISA